MKIGLIYTGAREESFLLNWLRQFGKVTLVMCDEQEVYYDCLVIGDSSPIPMPTPGFYNTEGINTQLEFFQSNLLEYFITERKIPIFGVGTGALMLWKFLKGSIMINPSYFMEEKETISNCLTTFPAIVHGDDPLYSIDWRYNHYEIYYNLPQVLTANKDKFPSNTKVLAWRTPLSKSRFKTLNLNSVKEGTEIQNEPMIWYNTKRKLFGTTCSPHMYPNTKGSKSWKNGMLLGDPVNNHVMKYFIDNLNSTSNEGILTTG